MPAPRALPRTLAVLTAVVLLCTAVPSPAAAGERRVVVPAAKPAWASAAADRGAPEPEQQIEVQVALELQDEQGAQDFATAVSTPGDPAYGQALSPADWIARFAPTQESVDRLITAAQQVGLTVQAVPKSRLFVLLRGEVADVDTFFATRVHEYAGSESPRFAAAAAVSLPRSAGSAVAAVSFGHATVTSAAQRSSATQGSSAVRGAAAAMARAPRCSTYWKQHTIRIPKAYGARKAGTPGCGYSAAQLRALSGLARSPLDGAGQTVAVVGAFGSKSIRADLARYSAANGLPDADYTESVPDRADWRTSPSCDPGIWGVEQSMDLEAVHAIAPAARLVYVGTTDCGYGFDVAMSTVLDDALASIVSNSWGSTGLDTLAAGPFSGDGGLAAELVVNVHQHIQAAGQGVGLYFASGDFGDDATVLGMPAVDFPASSPWVTAVGGTASGLDRRGKHLFSAPWGTNVAVAKRGRWSPKAPGRFVSGSGGGVSSLFTPPAYQRDVVPGVLSQGARALPDVAAVAAPETGMLVGHTVNGRYRTVVAGGTSLSTPIVAGQVALAQQAAGRTFGFLNPALYRLAAAGGVRDVAPSRTRRFVADRLRGDSVLLTLDRDSSLKVRRGWDAATGVGELTAASLRALAE